MKTFVIFLSVLFVLLVATSVYLVFIDAEVEIYRNWRDRGNGVVRMPSPRGETFPPGFVCGRARDHFGRRISQEDAFGREVYRVFRDSRDNPARIGHFGPTGQIVMNYNRQFDDQDRIILERLTDKDGSLVSYEKTGYDEEKHIATVSVFDSSNQLTTVTKVHFDKNWRKKTKIEIRSNTNQLISSHDFEYWNGDKMRKLEETGEYGLMRRNLYNRKGRVVSSEEYVLPPGAELKINPKPYLRFLTIANYDSQEEVIKEYNATGLTLKITRHKIVSDDKRKPLAEEKLFYGEKGVLDRREVTEYKKTEKVLTTYDKTGKEISRKSEPIEEKK